MASVRRRSLTLVLLLASDVTVVAKHFSRVCPGVYWTITACRKV